MFIDGPCGSSPIRVPCSGFSDPGASSYGRFLQPDPIGYGDALTWYNYVGGDPINLTDPTGAFCADGTSGGSAEDCGGRGYVENSPYNQPTIEVTVNGKTAGDGGFTVIYLPGNNVIVNSPLIGEPILAKGGDIIVVARKKSQRAPSFSNMLPGPITGSPYVRLPNGTLGKSVDQRARDCKRYNAMMASNARMGIGFTIMTGPKGITDPGAAVFGLIAAGTTGLLGLTDPPQGCNGN